jgi:hypothetical protein
MWVMKGRRYLVQVRDDEFHDLRKKWCARADLIIVCKMVLIPI